MHINQSDLKSDANSELEEAETRHCSDFRAADVSDRFSQKK